MVQPLQFHVKITIPTRLTLILIGIQVSCGYDEWRLNLSLRFNVFFRILITIDKYLLFQFSDQSNKWMNFRNNQSSKLLVLWGKTSNRERFNLLFTNVFLLINADITWTIFHYNKSDEMEENDRWKKYDNRQSSKLCIIWIEAKPQKTKG